MTGHREYREEWTISQTGARLIRELIDECYARDLRQNPDERGCIGALVAYVERLESDGATLRVLLGAKP